MRITVVKKAFWFQHQIEVTGSKEEWQRVVGVITLMQKRVIVRDPVFHEKDMLINLFYHSLSPASLYTYIEEVLDEDS